ncbi:unnamed protein product [marine sediment metagenome]|uniref:GlcNAc-PI de-N-acetylase n=1 Tax=marine sediment metagenome TaxID=412755 RepID=X0XVV6_9ZZZZ
MGAISQAGAADKVSNILVLSPHPDDEAIGCGGTLRQHVERGDLVHVIFVTSGERGGHGLPAAETRQRREAEALRAADIIGIHSLEFWRAPDGSVRASSALVDRLRVKLRDFAPQRLYIPHEAEDHRDHRATVRIVRRALAGIKSQARPQVLMYEVWTPLQQLDEIVDISNYVETKREAIRAYESQCAVMRFDEAALCLNRYRGEMHSWPGGDYAEAFANMNVKNRGDNQAKTK